ncbi:tRNA lysidine(34) synthetase TilS [Desulfonema ishimotonii]|uniref:tRNA(Ile)-lysidine synthase n=1 Tax=Desulfonema ishimotonii TaxID=45657 RepID=A0A401G3N7_9BACT|nr:tRNA lysidine(34) synthetase TilS [Desulfonema ishimotonii]GBC63791.1 tRNA lysidine(34) synthetase TilS [Desulfonema ishimotonii]
MATSYSSSGGKLAEAVSRTLGTYDMVRRGDAVLIGLSGGPDSVALAHILSELAPGLSLRLGVAHLHHGLRGKEADRDAEFAEALGRQLGLPVHLEKKDVRNYRQQHRLSTEEAARQVRYDFFERVCRAGGYDKVALGHHADDNAELVLMYLLRGSGPLGLSGIPPVRAGRFIRPLIQVTRAEILAFLAEQGLAFVTDSSNADPSYLRNRMRHHLIPLLKSAYNPNIIRTLNRSAAILRDEDAWLASVTDALWSDCVTEIAQDRIRLSRTALSRLPVAAQRRLLRKALAGVRGDTRRITFAHIGAMLGILGKSEKSLDLPDRVRVSVSGDTLCVVREKVPLRRPVPETGLTSFDYTLAGPGMLSLGEIGMRLVFSETDIKNRAFSRHAGQNVAFFDMEQLSFPFSVRNPRPGDRFTPLGMTGTQKLKTYFINRKVPRKDRMQCPVVLCRDKIIWVAGQRIDDAVKVTPATRRVLKGELLLA